MCKSGDVFGRATRCGSQAPNVVNVRVMSIILQTINLQNFQRSPRKKAKLSSGTSLMPPVVILFQDLEGFSAKILQDFIVMTR